MFWKTLGPNGTRITLVSWKAGSAPGCSESLGVVGFWRLLGQKGCPKDAFLNIMKIGNGTQIQLFRKVRCWDLLKTVPGSGFEKTLKIYENTIGKSMFFDGLKPLKSIEKQTFLDFRSFKKKTMKNRCQNESQKSWKIIQNGARGRPGSIYSWFLSIFGEGEKTWFFDEVPGRPKNKENRPVERQRLEKSPPADNPTTVKSPGGSRHSRLGIKRPTTRAWSHTPKGRRPGELSR